MSLMRAAVSEPGGRRGTGGRGDGGGCAFVQRIPERGASNRRVVAQRLRGGPTRSLRGDETRRPVVMEGSARKAERKGERAEEDREKQRERERERERERQIIGILEDTLPRR